MRIAHWVFCSVLVGLSGCGTHFEAATPPGFVELPDQEAYDYRATTADGLVIAVREIDHDPKGSLEFWARAIENRMRRLGGYALLGSHEVKAKSGLAGRQLRFGHDESGRPHLYTVTIFVTDDHIFLLEAGGEKSQVESHHAQLEWALANFQAD